MFSVTAITGRVGSALAGALLASGHEVRAIVRNEAKGAPWVARGCEVAIADMGDADRLAMAFNGVDGVFVLLPPMFDPTPGFPETHAMIAAIREALVKAAPPKAVVLSTIGADAIQPNLLNGLRFLERALADLPIPITFLRAAWFMENAEWDISAARDEGVLRSYLQPLDRAVAMIATSDVGRTAADLLLETWAGHRVIELEAEQRVTPNEIAAAFAKLMGHDVRAETVPPENWEALFREQGMRNPLPRIQMLQGFNAGWIDFGTRGPQSRIGTIGIEEAVAKLVRTKSYPHPR